MAHAPVTLLLAAAFALIAAVESNTYLECDCSPSSRGYRSSVLTELRLSRKAIEEFSKVESAKMAADKSVKASEVEKKVKEFAVTLWEACINNWDNEQCVNADVSLRGDESSFCKFNEESWANIVEGKVAHRCDLSDVLASEDHSIVSGKPEKRTTQRPSESPSPTPTKKVDNDNGGSPTTKVGSSAIKTNGSEAEAPSSTGSPSPFPTLAPKNDSTSSTGGNEGCVAVEHLRGYAMQHRSHLVRAVLCARGFCATPNHALIVGGQWTSMKHLCAGTWDCVRSVKLVNNLNVFKNRRVVIGDITITPYDLRFPRAGVFLVQSLESLLNFLLNYSVTLTVAIVFSLLAYKSTW